ncbi:MAG: sensor histidine kinase, partial [Chitinophagales bacterium]
RRVLMNLVVNSIKYGKKDGHTKIGFYDMDGYILIEVADNGIGINLERYSHLLFQPFKQIDSKQEGAGIGLSILNNTIKKNGGRIEVESKVGEGTTFTVYIKPYTMLVDV